MRRPSLLFSLPALLAAALTIAGQGVSTSLQNGTKVEKALSGGQSHTYTVRLEKDQLLQLAIEQRGIDVVVRIFLPDGKLLREFDSPTGAEGVDYVEMVADTAGTYRVEMTTLDGMDKSTSGRYELEVVELRNATEEELQIRKNESTRKAKGLALVIETAQNLDQFRLPENRVAMQIRAAQLLWEADRKKASELMAQSMETVKQVIAENAGREQDYETNQVAMGLRQQVINALAPHDPEAALKFLQSTRLSTESAQHGQPDPELQLEFALVNQVSAADPKRAFELAEDMLKRTSSALLIETVTRLASRDPELGRRLAHDIAKRLEGQDLIRQREAAYLAGSLLFLARSSRAIMKQDDEGMFNGCLLSDDDFRDLLLKVVSEVLSYSQAETNSFNPERDAVRNLVGVIAQMSAEVKTYAADRAEAIEKKTVALVGPGDPTGAEWQRYATAATNGPIESALESVTQAPASLRDYLYQQVANRVATTGDLSRAREIISERVSDPNQRRQALHNLQQQAVMAAAEKGRFDEALRLTSKFRPGPDRTGLINQILDHLGPGMKRSLALQYLEQAKNLVTTSARAADADQMQTILAIARTVARYDVNRAFQIVDPLLDQFNELSAAAVSLNGFGQEYYADGELITSNSNPVAEIASHLSETLATLAMFDFGRAKRLAEGINRTDVRLRAFLTIAERAMEIAIDPDDPEGYNTN